MTTLSEESKENVNGKPTMELLDEIINRVGAYSHDQLTHASNALDNSSKNAFIIKQRIEKTISIIKTEKWSAPKIKELMKILEGKTQ